MRPAESPSLHPMGLLLLQGVLCLLLGACGNSLDSEDGNNRINGSIHVQAGQTPADVRSVNGSIQIDPSAAVTRATTVNGSITLGARAQAGSLKTVNGAVSLDEDARAADIRTVNGALTLGQGADVAGSLYNVTGKISVTAAHVGGMIHTLAGDIGVSGNSKIDNGIRVEKPSGTVFGSDVPTVVIGPGVTVGGELRFERKVNLFVSDRATIGTVAGATAVTFSGATPPNAN